jgi:hypothetical protein
MRFIGYEFDHYLHSSRRHPGVEGERRSSIAVMFSACMRFSRLSGKSILDDKIVWFEEEALEELRIDALIAVFPASMLLRMSLSASTPRRHVTL